jgi:transketolase
MGKGVDFMENKHKYHGSPLSREQLSEALKQLNVEDDYEELMKKRAEFKEHTHSPIKTNFFPDVLIPKRRVYNDKIDLRSAFGNAAYDLVIENQNKNHVAVFDCDLAVSVKTDKIMAECKENFFQTGIQEHNTAIVSSAVSVNNILSIWAEFGVFGVCETYNQHRMNDINETNLKLFTTHVGLDVGEDGKTHQCIDYLGVMNNLYHFKTLVPADGNHTDLICKFSFKEKGNCLVAMGRSKLGILTKENGEIFYDENYCFEFGKVDKLRDGKEKLALLSLGTPSYEAMLAVDELKKENILVSFYIFHTINQIDKKMMDEIISKENILTVEDHNVNTGLGAFVENYLGKNQKIANVKKLGVTDYAFSGSAKDLFNIYEMDKSGIMKNIKEILKK